MSKDIFTKKDLQINSQKKSLTNKPWKKHIIQTKTLKRKYVPKIFEETSLLPKILCREIRTENLRRVIPVQTNFEAIFLRKNIWRESVYQEVLKISLPKSMWQSSLPKNPLKRHALPKAWREESPTKQNENMFGKIALTISLPRTLWREIYTKQISAVTSTEKVLDETFLPQTHWRKSLQNNFQKKPLPKNIAGKNLQNKYSQKSLYQNHVQRYLYHKLSADKFSEKISFKQNLEETHYSNKNSEEKVCTDFFFWKNITTQNSLQRNPYRKSQKSNSCPTKFWRETSSNK